MEPYVRTAVQVLVAEQMGVHEKELSDDTNIIRDLNADSLDAVELVTEFQETFQFSIPDADAEGLVTVGQICDYMCQQLLEKGKLFELQDAQLIKKAVREWRNDSAIIQQTHERVFACKFIDEYCQAFDIPQSELRFALEPFIANQWIWQFTTIPVARVGGGRRQLERAHLIFLCSNSMVHAEIVIRRISLRRFRPAEIRLDTVYEFKKGGALEKITVSHIRANDGVRQESFDFLKTDTAASAQRFLRKFHMMLQQAR